MTYAEVLMLAGLVLIAVAAAVYVRVTLDLRQRILITVTRPTTTDGETVQISSNVRVGANWSEIAGNIEKSSLAIQGRLAKQNEIVMQGQITLAHERWKRIQAKLDAEAKLTKEENRWWQRFRNDFDADGPKDTTKDAKIAQAAGDLIDVPAEG